MTVTVIHTLDVPPQPWRNGGGSTRELLAWPTAQDWQVRISLADIVQDGAFSAFPDVQRWFGVVQGAGVELRFAGKQVTQTLASEALHFDGATAPFCRLLDGATQDMNLMLRGNDATRGWLQQVVHDVAWQSAMPLRALFTTAAGVWCDDFHERRLQAYDFLWTANSTGSNWWFVGDEPVSTPLLPMAGAWWLGAQVHKEAL
ncbi:MAG: HutD family protein [Burkholderiaceae bacterium]